MARAILANMLFRLCDCPINRQSNRLFIHAATLCTLELLCTHAFVLQTCLLMIAAITKALCYNFWKAGAITNYFHDY